MLNRLKVFPLLVIVIALSAPVSGQQTQGSPAPSFVDLYEAVLDRVFPNPVGDFSGGKLYSLTLRYRPYHSPESQINITKKVNGALELTVCRLPQGAPPVSDQLAALLKAGAQRDVVSLSQQVKDETTTFTKVPGDLASLLDQFSTLALTLQLNTNIVLDGDVYEFWLDSDSNAVHFRLTADYRDPTRDYPLIRWMHSVKSATDGLVNLRQKPR